MPPPLVMYSSYIPSKLPCQVADLFSRTLYFSVPIKANTYQQNGYRHVMCFYPAGAVAPSRTGKKRTILCRDRILIHAHVLKCFSVHTITLCLPVSPPPHVYRPLT